MGLRVLCSFRLSLSPTRFMVEQEGRFQHWIWTLDPSEQADRCSQQRQAEAAPQYLPAKPAPPSRWGWGRALGPEAEELVRRIARGDHAPAAAIKVDGMDVFAESIGQEGHLQFTFADKPIAELDVFHHVAREVLIEKIRAQVLCLAGEIAGVKVLPRGRCSTEQGCVRKLETAFFKPLHKGA